MVAPAILPEFRTHILTAEGCGVNSWGGAFRWYWTGCVWKLKSSELNIVRAPGQRPVASGERSAEESSSLTAWHGWGACFIGVEGIQRARGSSHTCTFTRRAPRGLVRRQVVTSFWKVHLWLPHSLAPFQGRALLSYNSKVNFDCFYTFISGIIRRYFCVCLASFAQY